MNATHAEDYHLLRIMMRIVPLGVPEAPHPQALHVKHGPRVHQQFAVIGLRDGPVGVAEQDRRGLLH